MSTVQSLDRALSLLTLVSSQKEGMRITDLEEETGLPKSTIHRLLKTLVANDFVERNAENYHYRLGYKVVELASVYLNSLELKTEVVPYLHELAKSIGVTAYLAILQGAEATYLEKVESVNSIRSYTDIGKRVPLYCTSVGKVLLSGYSDNEIRELFQDIKLKKFTKNTTTDVNDLIYEIKIVRHEGVAFDNEEHGEGVKCVATPIYDYLGNIIAAMGVSGIGEFTKDIKEQMLKVSREVSEKFGYGKVV